MLVLRERVRTLGPLARLIILGALVGLLTAGTVAMWIEARLNELMLAQVAVRAQDQVQLAILSTIKSSGFELPLFGREAFGREADRPGGAVGPAAGPRPPVGLGDHPPQRVRPRRDHFL
jgi:hypothetical protein